MILSFTSALLPVFTDWPTLCYCCSDIVSPTMMTSFRIQDSGSSKHCAVQLLPVYNDPLCNWCFTEHLRGRSSFTHFLCFYQRRHQFSFLWKPRGGCTVSCMTCCSYQCIRLTPYWKAQTSCHLQNMEQNHRTLQNGTFWVGKDPTWILKYNSWSCTGHKPKNHNMCLRAHPK